ncbi:MAG TPA: T9SS type A sorting domain-containing protein [Paludibacteraceae bacterium]|nr:T9SS type A sorting domain-containing protein [Paludibacteraceae bacterium]
MKNNFFVIPIFLFSLIICPLKASDSKTFITKLNVLDNDSIYKYVYIYNNKKKAVENKYVQKTNQWFRYSQTEWTYDGENCTSQIERKWENKKWNPTYLIEYRYENNQLVEEIDYKYEQNSSYPILKTHFEHKNSKLTTKKSYQFENSNWRLIQEINYHYATDEKIDSILLTFYVSENEKQEFLSTFGYLLNGLISTNLIQQKDESDKWINNQLVQWYYQSGTQQVTMLITKKWNDTYSKWENYQKSEYEYLQQQPLSEIHQHWELAFWRNDFRYDYFYDKNGNLEKKVLSLPIYKKWRPVINIFYDNYTQKMSNVIKAQYDFWGGEINEPVTSYIPFLFNDEWTIKKAQRIEIDYDDFIDSTDTIANENNNIIKNNVFIYPNPSEGIFYLNHSDAEIQSWTVTALNGQMIISQKQPSSFVIDLTDCPKGIYILKVQTDDRQFIQKIIKK